MKRIYTKLTNGFLLALGSCGLAQADTTYDYTYSYSWSVPGSCNPSPDAWLDYCNLSGGTRTLASSTLGAPDSDPNLPVASITNKATGWADTRDPNDEYIAQGKVQSWGGGLGVMSLDEGTSVGQPNHATDNYSDKEVILYEFNHDIALSSVEITYSNTDSDITVLAYKGVDPWSLSTKLDNKKYSDLVSLGWVLIGNYADLVTNTPKTINASGVSSSYWLIGAANNLVAGGTNDGNKDYVKIASIGGKITTQFTKQDSPPGVPEPGSLALLGLGSLLLLRARSKR